MTVSVMEYKAKRDRWIAAARAALARGNLLQAEIACRKARRCQDASVNATQEAKHERGEDKRDNQRSLVGRGKPKG